MKRNFITKRYNLRYVKYNTHWLVVTFAVAGSMIFPLMENMGISFSHPIPTTGVNFMEYILEGGIDGSKHTYTYVNNTNTLTHIDSRNESNTTSKLLNSTEIHQLNQLVNSSDVLNKQIYDLSHTCEGDCQQYRVAYIYTIVNNDSDTGTRYSGVGLWNENSDHNNKMIFGDLGEALKNFIQ